MSDKNEKREPDNLSPMTWALASQEVLNQELAGKGWLKDGILYSPMGTISKEKYIALMTGLELSARSFLNQEMHFPLIPEYTMACPTRETKDLGSIGTVTNTKRARFEVDCEGVVSVEVAMPKGSVVHVFGENTVPVSGVCDSDGTCTIKITPTFGEDFKKYGSAAPSLARHSPYTSYVSCWSDRVWNIQCNVETHKDVKIVPADSIDLGYTWIQDQRKGYILEKKGGELSDKMGSWISSITYIPRQETANYVMTLKYLATSNDVWNQYLSIINENLGDVLTAASVLMTVTNVAVSIPTNLALTALPMVVDAMVNHHNDPHGLMQQAEAIEEKVLHYAVHMHKGDKNPEICASGLKIVTKVTIDRHGRHETVHYEVWDDKATHGDIVMWGHEGSTGTWRKNRMDNIPKGNQ